MHIVALILLLIVLFILSAFFSSAETVLFSLTPTQRSRIRERSAKSDERIESCLSDSALCLSTILVGNTLVNFAIATLGYIILDGLFPTWGGIAAVPLMTVLLLVFGEVTPKQIALRKAERLAPASAALLVFWRFVLSPVLFTFKFAERAFAPILKRERRALSDAELVSVLENAAEHGEFASADAEMIEGVLRLSEIHANDEMTPRVDMEVFDIDIEKVERVERVDGKESVEGGEKIVEVEKGEGGKKTYRHRYLPVIRRSPDVIEGMMDTETGKIEDALFVPEQVTLDDLLLTFRKSGKPLAIVLDEYGGTAGLITPNDILELIFGPKIFGSNNDEPAIVRTGKRTWIIDARASLDEINRLLDLELEADDADRLAGWVAFHAERLPHVGQQIEADGCRATILKRRRRRVTRVKLEILKYPETDTDEEMLAETDEAVEKTEEDDM